MRLSHTVAIMALAAAPTIAAAQNAPAAPAQPAAPGARPAYSTAESTIGALMADRAAWEVVLKHISGLGFGNQRKNPQVESMTLKDMQEAVRGLNDKVLAALDADLAKLPAHAPTR